MYSRKQGFDDALQAMYSRKQGFDDALQAMYSRKRGFDDALQAMYSRKRGSDDALQTMYSRKRGFDGALQVMYSHKRGFADDINSNWVASQAGLLSSAEVEAHIDIDIAEDVVGRERFLVVVIGVEDGTGTGKPA